ncbi:MAG: ADP-forming succinate--CoA ligase subunit beta [Dethiobacter sp.]|jgi:succinyl-CoA synthetase beta subunit|nr:MAG: ADP-forming succinate--CoA ligase subunit beta [Dethiobacter sp.]
MKLYEYMGKDLLAGFGITIPQGKVVCHPQEAASAFKEIGPAVIKTQVLTGKRGKAGGIAFVNNPREAQNEAGRLLGMTIGGFKVERLLVESKLQIDRELYLAIVLDGTLRYPVVLTSTRGGMDIEEVPPEFIVKYPVRPSLGLQPFMAREICRRLDLKADLAKEFSTVLLKLYRLFKERDAELVEINPLVLSKGRFIAADAKVTIDDDALFRQKDLVKVEERTDLEKKAHELGLAFVELDGDIAVMANGAGMAMATLDMIHYYGGRPANFLDAGGGAGVEQTAQALELLLATKPRVIMINIFGGITRCDDVANAFAKVKREKNINVPVVFRLVGTNEEAGRKILDDIGVSAYGTMRETAQKAVELAG